MRIVKDPCLIKIGPNHFPPVRAVGEHIKFNKTTERKSSQRKTSSFYEKRRLNINQKVENDSQITIHRTHVNKKIEAQ